MIIISLPLTASLAFGYRDLPAGDVKEDLGGDGVSPRGPSRGSLTEVALRHVTATILTPTFQFHVILFQACWEAQ
jgi:hypothetical protein